MGLRVGVLAAVLGLATTSSAQQADDQSGRAFFQAGTRLYEQGEFEEAARQYQLAYERSGRPQMLYNVYLAHRDAGDEAEAFIALERYLADAESIENRAFLEARLEALREGEQPSVELEPPERRSIAGPVSLIAAGAALGVGAAISGTMALRAKSDLEDGCPGRTSCDEALLPDRDRAENASLVTDILWPIAGAMALGGLLWLLVGRGSDTPQVDASCSPRGCNGRVEVSF